MAKSISLSNGQEWKTQKAAQDHFRAILHFYRDGDVISDAAHHDDLAALLERYDTAITEAPSKIGVGIERFERRVNADSGWSTPGFWVVRTDGSATDFSFYTGIKGQPKAVAQEFADACRAAVAEDLKRAKRKHFDLHKDGDGRVLCDLTDQPIAFEDAHLDHAHPSFGVMVIMFRAAKGWHEDIPAGVLTPPQDGQTTTTFADEGVAAQFRELHHRGAKLRIIGSRKNLAMAAGQRAPKIKRPVEL